jgi:hypothetical protein
VEQIDRRCGGRGASPISSGGTPHRLMLVSAASEGIDALVGAIERASRDRASPSP